MKRKSSTKETSVEPVKIRDVTDIINDVPVDWKGFKIPKKLNNRNLNLTENQSVESDKRLNIQVYSLGNVEWNSQINKTQSQPTRKSKSVKQHSFEEELHKKSPEEKNWICNTDQINSNSNEKKSKHKPSKSGHRDDFEISKQDKIEIRRKLFEEKYWKTQVQKRYGTDQRPPPHLQIYQENCVDPRLQKWASPALSSQSPAQVSSEEVSPGPRDTDIAGKARRELFAIDTAMERREREYEERLQREFKRSKEERKGGPIKAPRLWFYGTTN